MRQLLIGQKKIDRANLRIIRDSVDHCKIFKTPNRDFKILQLTDIHYGGSIASSKPDKKAFSAIVKIVEAAKPDLIVLTGDIVFPVLFLSGTTNNLKQFKKIAALFEAFEVPWCFCFGNHDCEVMSKYNKDAIGDYLESLPHCLFKKGPSNIDGCGNYVVEIMNTDGTLHHALFFMDSNMYTTDSFFSGFDHIHDNQIEWYKDEVNKLKQRATQNDYKSLAFFHIPCTEFKTAYRELRDGNKKGNIKYFFGEIGEKNGYLGVPEEPSKIFDVMVELDSTKGIFVGHDHLNNISIEYKGIRLTYGMSIDYLAYFRIKSNFWQRGGTLIRLQNKDSFTIEQIKLSDLDPSTILDNKYG